MAGLKHNTVADATVLRILSRVQGSGFAVDSIMRIGAIFSNTAPFVCHNANIMTFGFGGRSDRWSDRSHVPTFIVQMDLPLVPDTQRVRHENLRIVRPSEKRRCTWTFRQSGRRSRDRARNGNGPRIPRQGG